MSIQFIIRDDDLCYFTEPAELASLYADVWKSFPITFAAVPWQSGAFAGHVPLAYWHTNQCFPLGENTELVSMVKAQLANGSIDIALHGIHHTYAIRRNQIIPELIDFKGDFGKAVVSGKQYLDKLFGTDIKVFVPPSNTLRPDLAQVLIAQGWNLLNLPGLRRNTRPALSFRHQAGRMNRLISFLRDGVDMSAPLVWPKRWEVGGFPLTPTTDLENLKHAFRLAVERGHPFVLATHYWEHRSFLPGGSGRCQYDSFRDFLDFVSGFNIKPVRASDLTL